jgi:hypothetical protein
LPTAQREVVELCDVQGWSASDTADALGITDVNQRVLLTAAAKRSATPSTSTSVRPDQPVHTGGGIRCAETIELVTLHLGDALDDRDRRLFRTARRRLHRMHPIRRPDPPDDRSPPGGCSST